MNFAVDSRIFTDFDDPLIGVTIVNNADNTCDISDVHKQTVQLMKQIRQEYKSETLSQQPKIAAWRDAHRQFGSKPKDYLSSVEALYKRVLKGGDLSTINPLVDIYNYISLKYMLPAGGEDSDKIQGNLQLSYAGADEKSVIVLGKDEAQAPAPGEVIYKDDIGTICRRWNWREVERTILTAKTKNCILVLEAIEPVTKDELEKAQAELAKLVSKYCQAKVTNFIVSATSPTLDF